MRDAKQVELLQQWDAAHCDGDWEHQYGTSVLASNVGTARGPSQVRHRDSIAKVTWPTISFAHRVFDVEFAFVRNADLRVESGGVSCGALDRFELARTTENMSGTRGGVHMGAEGVDVAECR
jgi:hypothetical protein